jgi:hypothetical protein
MTKATVANNASANTIKDKLNHYLWNDARLSCTVVREAIDAAGAVVADEVTDDANIVRYKYTATLTSLIDGKSYGTFKIGNGVNENSASWVTINQDVPSSPHTIATPHAYIEQLSGLPFKTGNFKINVPIPNESPQETVELAWNASPSTIYNKIYSINPTLKGRIEVYDGVELDKYSNGRIIIIRFYYDFKEAYGQLELVAGSTPLPAGFVMSQGTIVPFSKDLFFQSIPMEWMYTIHEKPQVILKNDGLYAVCPDMNCEYTYVNPPVGTEITAFSYTAGVLTITGTSLPTTNYTIEFAMVACIP